MSDVRYVDALEYLKESRDGLSENYDNESAIEIVENLQALGCAVLVEIEEDHLGEERSSDALFITLPEKITVDHLLYIANLRPDEISEEDNGQIRLWWD